VSRDAVSFTGIGMEMGCRINRQSSKWIGLQFAGSQGGVAWQGVGVAGALALAVQPISGKV
jgi:hypothetical protein